jgi:hypothetical protein
MDSSHGSRTSDEGEQMAEQTETETQQEQQQWLQGAAPLLVSVAVGAAAGALAVVARKGLSGGGGGGGGGTSRERASDEGRSSSDGGTSFDDVEKVADDLERLIDELRSAYRSEDFHRLVEIADTISEYADQAADAFNAAGVGEDAEGGGSERRVTDELMSRISEIIGGATEKADSGSRSKSAERSRGD